MANRLSKGASQEVLERMRDRRVESHNRKRELQNSKWITDEHGIVHIPLRDGHEALIDSVDSVEAKKYSWRPMIGRHSKTVYVVAHLPGVSPRKEIFLHNLVFMASEGKTVDHRDRNGLNCTRSNLREASGSQNATNRKRRLGKNPHTGVYMVRENRWTACIQINGKWKSLGRFQDLTEAISARENAAKRIYGEFAI